MHNIKPLFCVFEKIFQKIISGVFRTTLRIYMMYEKRILEFNYKLLHGILNNNAYVSKWNKDVSQFGEICKDEEHIKHLLYDCKINKTIWEKVSSFLKFDATWKIIVLIGFFNEISD